MFKRSILVLLALMLSSSMGWGMPPFNPPNSPIGFTPCGKIRNFESVFGNGGPAAPGGPPPYPWVAPSPDHEYCDEDCDNPPTGSSAYATTIRNACGKMMDYIEVCGYIKSNTCRWNVDPTCPRPTYSNPPQPCPAE